MMRADLEPPRQTHPSRLCSSAAPEVPNAADFHSRVQPKVAFHYASRDPSSHHLIGILEVQRAGTENRAAAAPKADRRCNSEDLRYRENSRSFGDAAGSDANSSIPAVSASPSLANQSYPVTDEEPSSTISSNGRSSLSNGPSIQNSSYSVPDLESSSDTTTVTVVQVDILSISPYASVPLSSDASSSVSSTGSITSEETSSSSTASSRISAYVPSQALYPYKNATRTSNFGTANVTTSTITPGSRGQCTGCALAALNPMTTSYQSELFGDWTSFVVTETIVTEFVTYVNNATIDTIVTETKTVNQTKTVSGYITDTAAEFNIYLPTAQTLLTLDVGPTYVIYTSLFGGPDVQVASTAPNNATHSMLKPTECTCRPQVTSLSDWLPTRSQDWDLLIQTFADGSELSPTAIDSPVPVPTKLQRFLAQDPDLRMYFQGADIATCSLAGISEGLVGNPSRTFDPEAPAPTTPEQVSAPQQTAPVTTRPATSVVAPSFSRPGTNTFLKTTFATTSKHITKQGCLRCDTKAGDRPQAPTPTNQNPNTDQINGDPNPTNSPEPKTNGPPKPNDKPNPNDNPPSNVRPQSQTQNGPPNPSRPDIQTSSNVQDFISSVISDNPDLTRRPQDRPTDIGQAITIGDSVVTVKQPQPTEQNQGGPNQQVSAPTMVIVGTQTIRVGQTTTINGIPVVVPTAGGGSTLIVGDKTIGINPRITQAPMPVLTVGSNTITANPQGEFVVGTQTLQPGGPLVILDDNTLTLGPGGKIAIWNDASQTLVTMFGQPAATFGGQEVTARLIGGNTVFVVGDKTLSQGGAITVDGTTFSLPAGSDGSSVVVNGQTRRLGAGLPVLTVNDSPVTAVVADGRTGFVLAPGQTLTPGGVLIVGDKTYSLPTEGQGSVVVVNGVTSQLNPSNLPVLPLNREEVTATIVQGTTAFVFGPDQTLTPGGIITVSGTTFSFPISGSVVVINGVTSTLNMGSIAAAPIVVDGQTITATTRDGTIEYVVNSETTLFPGGQVVIDGTTYSLAPGGTAMVINGKTSMLSNTPASNTASATASDTTSERGVGDFIASGIGESSQSRGAGNLAHSGGADKWVENLMIGAAGWLMLLV
ncbi:hypothetical protein OPT61_g7299 [Boeremia exigua]|uniref:Uncharacterized protein n=1 Tax=Boeremia exigua TaxID=749465 RepID=A0ACC2I2U4_9PLEO|nr:hypothetical protein OPT61_g7299 [Boeremia exigua]